MVQKNLIALCALAVCSISAFAQDSGNTASTTNTGNGTTEAVIYGRVQAAAESVRVSNDPYRLGGSGTTGRLNSDNSYIGLRVKENLGGGLSAFADLQMGVDVDDGNSSTYENKDRLRRSIIGLQGNLGTVWGGRDETAYYAAGREYDPFYNMSSATSANILGHAPYSYGIGSGTELNSRFGNTVGYKSNSWNNLSVAGTYTVNEHDPANLNARVASVAVNYKSGPLMGTVAYEKQKFENFGPTDKTGVKAAVSYGITDATRVSFVAERLSSTESNRYASVDFDRNAYSLGVSHRVGAGEVLGAYTVAKGGVSSDAGASQLSLGYRYNFSKRTSALATATLLNNKSNANYDLNFRPVGVVAGNDVRVFGLGLEHRF